MKKWQARVAITLATIGIWLPIYLHLNFFSTYSGFYSSGVLEAINDLNYLTIFWLPVYIVGEAALIWLYFCDCNWTKWVYLFVCVASLTMIFERAISCAYAVVPCINNKYIDELWFSGRITHTLTQMLFLLLANTPSFFLFLLSFRKQKQGKMNLPQKGTAQWKRFVVERRQNDNFHIRLVVVLVVIGIVLPTSLHLELLAPDGVETSFYDGFLDVIFYLTDKDFIFIWLPLYIGGEAALIWVYYCDWKYTKWIYLFVVSACAAMIFERAIPFTRAVTLYISNAYSDDPTLIGFIAHYLTQMSLTLIANTPSIVMLILSCRKQNRNEEAVDSLREEYIVSKLYLKLRSEKERSE